MLMINLRLRAVLLAAALVAAASAAAFAQSSAWLMQASGGVQVMGPSGPIEVHPPAALPEGATIRTGSGGLALIVTADGSKVQVRADSDFALTTASPSETTFTLLKGAISCWVRRQDGRRFKIRSSGSVAAARGAVFDVAGDGRTSRIDLFQGEVLVADSFGGRTIASPGQRVTVSAARGLIGTSSLPPGARATPEPAAGLPPAALKAAAPAPKEKAAAVASEPAPAVLTPAPAPPPKQQATAVSPSAP